MKNSFKKALKLYKYLFLLLTIVYWIYIVIDDYVFIEKYWPADMLMSIGIWARYFLVYTLAFSFYYWLLSTVIILIYHKLINTKKDTNNITGESETIVEIEEGDKQTHKKYSYKYGGEELVIEQKNEIPSSDDIAYLNGRLAPTKKYQVGIKQFVFVSNGKVYAVRGFSDK